MIMNDSTVPLEFEFQVSTIATVAFPSTRYSLSSEVSRDWLKIEFEGFFTEEFEPKNRPHQNPSADYYRNCHADFSLMYVLNGGYLILSGWWRRELLSLHYKQGKQLWMNEDGDQISTPYPDGDRLETIAKTLYPVVERYFKVRFPNSY